MKVVIIGGVAGGATAAARIRRLDERAEIVMLERTGYVSYANCGLPYYIGGEIADEEDLTLQTPASFYARYRVDVRVHSEALSIDRAGKTVLVKNLETGETYRESYDKLLLSPGAKATVPPGARTDDARVFTLRTVEDTLAIHGFVKEHAPSRAVVIGGGFIGLELTENLMRQGVRVTLIQRGEQVLAPLDADMAAFLHIELCRRGVDLRLGESFSAIETGERLTVRTDKGAYGADFAAVAVGVSPESDLARDARLALGVKGSIAVDAHMRTSDADIYAVGDAVEVRQSVTDERTLIALAGPANKQGRIAADNICGGDSEYRGSQGSSVVRVFSLTAASTGINEKTARRLGLHYGKVVLSPNSHASYYPGAQVMTMKVLFERGTDRLLGAQIVGGEGVDKRIDVLATAIRENIVAGRVKQFHVDEADALPRDGSVVLLDTRTPREYARGHAEGFVNLPLDELRGRLSEVEKGKPVYVMCQSGLRSYLACRILTQNGYDCYNFSGGYRFYDAVRRGSAQAVQAYHNGMEK